MSAVARALATSDPRAHSSVVASDAREDLIARLRAALEPRAEVLDAYLFGSYATGRASAHSDVDVAVFVRPEALDLPGFGYAAELVTDLMHALAQNRVDVLILNRAGPLVYHRVLRDGVRIVSRDLRATTVREGRALSLYCDYVPQLAKIDRAAATRARSEEFGR